jgi:hypothetical protein
VQNTTTFGGGITNSGAISADAAAILLFGVSTFAGGISNGGVISASVGIALSSLSAFVGGSGSGGAIVNTGKITGVFGGIRVNVVDTFARGIINSKGGAITVKSGAGIFVGATPTSTSAFVSSFLGGITNSGTISGGAISGGLPNVGVFVANVSIFSGGIVNNSGGRIAAGSNGIEIKLVTTFTGGISNSGTIIARSHGIVVSSVAMFGSGGPGGGITNTGAISVSNAAIEVSTNVGSFTGGISNSGKLTALGEGIFVNGVAFFGNSSSGGGITNSGTISAGHSGIRVGLVFTSFSGGTSNASSGKIVSTQGIGIFVGTSIGVFGNSSAGGGITNSGTISARQSGILLQNFTTFVGGISNSGRIASTIGDGIDVFSVAVFDNGSAGGGIINSGTISVGQNAIAVIGSAIFAGGISNSGRIASQRSILVTDVGVFGDSAGGGIANTGTMQGGIFLREVATFVGSIVNGSAGKIINGGINISTGTLFGAGSVAGGITNAGTISVGGIAVNTATFLGDISNSGKIVGGNGIALTSVAIFGGSGSDGAIVNGGLISATHDGLRLMRGEGTFAGGITNAGLISAGLLALMFLR